MYEVLKEAGTFEKPRQLCDLIALAKEGARKKLAGSETKNDRVDQQPWRWLGPFMEDILTQSGAASKADGTPIEPGFSSGLAEVSSLADDWEIRADGEILAALLLERDDVSQHDIPNLAGALYHSRDDAAQLRVLKVIAYLIQAGRAKELVVDGVRLLRSSDAK